MKLIQYLKSSPTMRIDPGSKWFVTLFAVVVLGVIGFLIASIFIKFDDNDDLVRFDFKQSKFSISVRQQKDKSYVVEVYNGNDNCAISFR